MYALLFINYGIYLFIFIFIGIFICNGNMHSNRHIVVREYILFHLIIFNYIINPVFGLLFISCGKMVGDLFARKIAKPVRLYKVLGIVVHIQRELFHRSEVNKKLSFHTWPRVLPQHQCHWWYSLAAQLTDDMLEAFPMYISQWDLYLAQSILCATISARTLALCDSHCGLAFIAKTSHAVDLVQCLT